MKEKVWHALGVDSVERWRRVSRLHKAFDRKVRLFSVACCYRVSALINHEVALRALEATELMVDGSIDHEEWLAIKDLASDLRYASLSANGESNAQHMACYAAIYAADTSREGYPLAATLAAKAESIYRADSGSTGGDGNQNSEPTRQQLLYFNDIFGNPFQTVRFNRKWRTADVVSLALAFYDGRAFEQMPILADALMDAGCEDEQIIAHCRGDGPHVRGCWVVDLILGKV